MSLSKSTYHSSKTIGNFLFSSEKTITKKACYDFLYEKENHLGNVRAVVSDLKLSTLNVSTGVPEDFEPVVATISNYYSFGMLQAGRNFNSGDYEYGFNGKRMDSEVSGTGNSYDYGFRVYNPRIGKFLSVDPLTKDYPWYTPYQFAGNTPIQAIDLDGLEPAYVNGAGYSVSGSDHNFNYNPLYESPQLQQAKLDEKAAIIQKNKNMQKAVYSGTIKQAKSNSEKFWVRLTPTWSQSWIKTDPVLKSVSVGGAVVTVGVALPSIQTVYNSAQATYLTIEGSKGAIAVGTGFGLGMVKSYTEAPQDLPVFFNNPYVNFVDEGVQILYKITTETMKYKSSDNQSDESTDDQNGTSSNSQSNTSSDNQGNSSSTNQKKSEKVKESETTTQKKN